MTRKHGILMAVGIVVGLTLLAMLWLAGMMPVETGEHLAHVDWLPAEASDVCFYRSYPFTAYEFDISEPGFLAWAKQWDVQPITQPVTILRHGFANRTAPPDHAADELTQEEILQQIEAWRAIGEATVSSGYHYADEQSDGGGVWVAYDRDKRRAYYHDAPR